MKRFILVVSILSILSCKNKADNNYAVISGKILNNNAQEISIWNRNRSINLKIKIDSLGTFKDTLRAEPQTLSFYDGKNYNRFYIEPNSHVQINYNADDFKNTLEFSGAGSAASNYLSLKEQRAAELMGSRVEFFSLNELSYKSKSRGIKTAMLTLLDSFSNVSELFKEMEGKDIHYEYLNNLNSYERTHQYYTKNPDFKVSEEFLSEFNGLNYTNEVDFKQSVNYKALVQNYFRNIASEKAIKDSLDRSIAYLKVISDIPNQVIKNELLFDEVVFGIKYVNDVESYYNIFRNNSTDEENNNKIEEIYNNLKHLAKGNPSPEFIGYQNYDGSTTSLSDLKGKYVYIDVWATWCGPCKAEIPFLKRVESSYHDKNIHFVSISVDKLTDKDKWIKMIEEKELTGIQLLADKDFESDFVKGYMINGIPQFILLDPNGNIVDRNAPRPSNTKLIELLDELNI
ncbi:TlpA disulfide reductase family protein [Snuella lapsa]|uniref:Thioredoxin domain-containing protein n=1 Tax=Snuella lapsa TaxID=870481 RepID=A0ABP6XY53_9FLAO